MDKTVFDTGKLWPTLEVFLADFTHDNRRSLNSSYYCSWELFWRGWWVLNGNRKLQELGEFQLTVTRQSFPKTFSAESTSKGAFTDRWNFYLFGKTRCLNVESGKYPTKTENMQEWKLEAMLSVVEQNALLLSETKMSWALDSFLDSWLTKF